MTKSELISAQLIFSGFFFVFFLFFFLFFLLQVIKPEGDFTYEVSMKIENKCKNRYTNTLACKYVFIDQATSLWFWNTSVTLQSREYKFITFSADQSAIFVFCFFCLLWGLICLLGHCTGSKLCTSKFKDSRIRTQELNPR